MYEFKTPNEIADAIVNVFIDDQNVYVEFVQDESGTGCQVFVKENEFFISCNREEMAEILNEVIELGLRFKVVLPAMPGEVSFTFKPKS